MSLKFGISDYNSYKFSLSDFTTMLFALKGILQVNYEKNLMILPVSLLSSQYNTGQNLTQILPQNHTQFDFFCWLLMTCVMEFN